MLKDRLSSNLITELLSAAIRKRSVFDILNQYLRFSYLQVEAEKKVWKKMTERYSKTGRVPTIGQLQQAFLDDEGALEIAKRSRGTPRLANRLLKRVRDFAQVEGDGAIDYDVAKTALDRLEVDSMGLDNTDRNILETMIHKFGGGPVGLDTLAAAIGEDSGTLEEVYEPYLIKNGFINRTPRGRIVTEHCYRHFGLENLIE